MWRRVGSPLVSDDGDSPRAKASSRSPSPTTVAFDLTHKLDGEDVLFALDVGSGTRSPPPHFYLLVIHVLTTAANKERGAPIDALIAARQISAAFRRRAVAAVPPCL